MALSFDSIWRPVLRHALARQRAPIGVALLVMLAGVGIATTQYRESFGGTWGAIDALITVATLLTAQVVWWSEAAQEWRSSLPPRISVSLSFEDQLVAKCDHAPLVGEPRAFAQQIGGQMLQTKHLLFWPVLEGGAPQLELWNGQWVLHHDLNIVLRELPPGHVQVEHTILWTPENRWGRDLDG